MKRITATFVSLLFMGAAFAASAATLDQARRDGLVGERLDGYIGAVNPSPTPDIRELVASVNAQRKAEYQKIAAQNGQTVTVVEKLAAQKLIGKATPGTYVMTSSGQWAKK